jgi:hypothetical protein
MLLHEHCDDCSDLTPYRLVFTRGDTVTDPTPQAMWVLGMHRSGTSATTRMLSLLGVETTRGELIPPDDDNPRGYWESRVLTSLNDRLLIALGCHWSAPPTAQEVSSREAELGGFDAEVKIALAAALGRGPVVWKDPRLCVLWPYWKRVAGPPQAVVVVHRAPLEIADSLRRRNGFSTQYSLALWERHMRSALLAGGDAPVQVEGFSGLLADPRAWQRRMTHFLAVAGFDAGTPERDIADELLIPRAPREEESAFLSCATPQQVELLNLLRALDGSRSDVSPESLPPESPGTTELLHQAQGWWSQKRAVNAFQRTVDDLKPRLEQADARAARLEDELRAAAVSAEAARAAAEADVAQLEVELKNTTSALSTARTEADNLRRRLNNVLMSTSWRVTAPLRRVSDIRRR